MGKTYKRNSSHKPKTHGRTFEKKDKEDKWKQHKYVPVIPDVPPYDERTDVGNYT